MVSTPAIARPDRCAASQESAVGSWPVYFSLLAYLGICLMLFLLCLRANNGVYVYPLDDTYIGMAMAKHFSQRGVWGITPYEFSSSTSTPLFVLLLSAIYRLTGPSELTPLLLSFAFGAMVLVAADSILRDYIPSRMRMLALLAVVFLVPLYIVGLIGMEHTLHILLFLIFLAKASDVISKTTSDARLLLLVTPAAVMVRYETLFFVAVVAVFLVAQRRWKIAGWLGVCAGLPVTAYGALSVVKGWSWLPSPVAYKGTWLHYSPLGVVHPLFDRIVSNVFRAPHCAALLTAMIVVLAMLPRSVLTGRVRIMLWLMVIGFVLHLATAGVGWVYRYEAYLITGSIVALACAAPSFRGRGLEIAALVLISSLPVASLVTRAVRATADVVPFSHAIYSQQYQMARFFSRYYNGALIAANDVGAINYKADLKCLDLMGLTNTYIFGQRKNGSYTTHAIEAEAARRGTQVAVVSDNWFTGEHPELPALPNAWIRVGSWRAPYKAILGDQTVSFYAARPEEKERLERSLADFSPSLPNGVQVLNADTNRVRGQ